MAVSFLSGGWVFLLHHKWEAVSVSQGGSSDGQVNKQAQPTRQKVIKKLKVFNIISSHQNVLLNTWLHMMGSQTFFARI